MSSPGATYYTTSDSRFFLGTVALINSLRLTGHRGDIVVLDLGLSEIERRRLAPIAAVEEPYVTPDAFPKAFPAPDRTQGLIVVIDSDILVVASLRHVFEEVERGKICLFHDPDHRWFAEWQEQFALRAPLRRGQRYANSGFVAYQIERWPWLLERWTEAVGRIPQDRLLPPELDPFRDPDQDALNAVLMSEVPAGVVSVQPEIAMAHPDDLLRVRIVSERELVCTDRGQRVTILHHSAGPKAWMPRGWKRDFRQAYVRLLPRVLCGKDVALRLEHDELPFWLRPTRSGQFASRAVRITHAAPGTKNAAKGIRAAVRTVRGHR